MDLNTISLSILALFFLIMLVLGKGRARYLLFSGFLSSILTREITSTFPNTVKYYQNIESTLIIFLAITVIIGFTPKASKSRFGIDTILLALTGSTSILVNGLNSMSLKAQTISASQSTIVSLLLSYRGWVLLVAGASIILAEILKTSEPKKLKKK